jgi:hypothetical protein
LQERYTGLGGMICAVDTYAGLVIMKSAEVRSMEAVKAARHHKQVWQALEKFVYGGDVFAFFAGHGLMIFAILVHAGRIKSNAKLDMLLALSGYHERSILSEMSESFSESRARNL